MVNTVSLLDDVASPWESVLQVIRSECGEWSLTILDAIGYEGFFDGYACLTAPDKFRETWLNSHYGELLRKTFAQVLGSAFKDYRVRLLMVSEPAPEMKLGAASIPQVVIQAAKQAAATSGAAKKNPAFENRLYSRYTFENFVEGSCNSTALRACETVVENPGDMAMNPLLVYGASGLGKTHLLQAIAAKLQATKKHLKVVYCQAYEFLRAHVAIAENAKRGAYDKAKELTAFFHERFEECDVLLIDDVQLLEKGIKTQKRLAYLIRKLRSLGKQVVLSCDRHPSAFKKLAEGEQLPKSSSIPRLTENLLTPLESCVAVGLDEPDLNTRMGVVQKKSEKIPFVEKDREEICRYLSMAPRSNVRLLEGLLSQIRAVYSLGGTELTLLSVKQIVGVQHGEEDAPLTLKSIAEAVAANFNVDLLVLSSKRQDAGASLPRKVAMYLCREMTTESLQKVGAMFNRDYATVIASIRSLGKQMDKDAALARRVSDIRYMLEG